VAAGGQKNAMVAPVHAGPLGCLEVASDRDGRARRGKKQIQSKDAD